MKRIHYETSKSTCATALKTLASIEKTPWDNTIPLEAVKTFGFYNQKEGIFSFEIAPYLWQIGKHHRKRFGDWGGSYRVWLKSFLMLIRGLEGVESAFHVEANKLFPYPVEPSDNPVNTLYFCEIPTVKILTRAKLLLRLTPRELFYSKEKAQRTQEALNCIKRFNHTEETPNE
jgi:hypothetical protein